jgi:predicted AlkP superfamily phosphohydrolase/phosphomutase
MSRRLLMLGLDSIDWYLVNEWAAAGHLPVLRELLHDSQLLFCGEANRALPGSVWTDIATGVSAGTHGYVDLTHLTPDSYRFEHIDERRLSAAPFYQLLSDAGVRCAVVDFPIDYLLRDFNGMQIVDWGTEFKLGRFATQPSQLAAQLVATYGGHPLTDYDRTGLALCELVGLTRQLARGIEVKRRFAVDLLRRRQHEFVFFNFAELHKAGHFFWKFHDRTHPDFTAAEPRLTDSLREIYQQMDRAIGSVLEQLGGDDELVVVTDRGMYAEYRGEHLVERILLKLDLAVPRGRTGAPGEPARASESWRTRILAARSTREALRFVGQLLPESVRQALLPFHRAAVGESAPLDWRKTQVFAIPSVGNSHLRINLAGRDPLGAVSAGAQYQRLLSETADQFRALINPETGAAAVEAIYFPSTQFCGPRSSELPDIAVVWNSKSPINAVASPAIGTISGRPAEGRTGNHRPDGFALFRGSSYVAGGRTQAGDARQIAPAILNHFGIAAPAYYEKQAPVIDTDLTSTGPTEYRMRAARNR